MKKEKDLKKILIGYDCEGFGVYYVENFKATNGTIPVVQCDGLIIFNVPELETVKNSKALAKAIEYYCINREQGYQSMIVDFLYYDNK